MSSDPISVPPGCYVKAACYEEGTDKPVWIRRWPSEQLARTMLTSAGPNEGGGFDIQLEGGACRLLIEAFAEQFKEGGAVNFLEVNFESEELGPMSVTIQRTQGKTPGQLKSEAVAQRDELLAALREIEHWSSHTAEYAADFGSNGVRDFYRTIAKRAIAKAEAQ